MTDIIKNAQLAPAQEFQRMDADGDGAVDRSDFLRAPHRLLAELGIPEESAKGRALLDANETQWKFLLSLGDADGDGVLTADEYIAARTSPGFRSADRPGKGDVCRTLFDLLDRDDDGSLDEDEFLRAADFLCMSEAEARGYFAELDADGSGRLSPKEFLKAVKRFYTS
ncbi:EF-hand domain-containing protein [Streptomyces aureoversilis]|uniref:EF-hand domain-containing protein n=1 Tax=Streptomyces aureoversilis TaxID=67277 RepID=A0ABW0A6V6_9ACTN